MKKFYHIVIFFFSCQITFSQKVVDIEADLFNIERGELFLYKINGDFTKEIEIFVEPDKNKEQQIVIEYTLIKQNEIPKGVMSIDSLESKNYKDLLDLLKGKLFIEKDEEKNYVNILEVLNNYFFRIKTYYNKKKHNIPEDTYYYEWEFDNRELLSYFIIRLNHSKSIITFIENWGTPNRWGYILPFTNRMRIIWDRDYYFYSENKIAMSLDSIKNIHRKIEPYPNLEDDFNIINNSLKDLSLNQNVLEKDFEDLSFMSRNFIVGREKNKIFVYNLYLKNIAPKNLRAILPEVYGSKFVQVLIGNTLKYLILDGTLFDKLPKGYASYVFCGNGDMVFDYDIKKKKILFEIDKTKYKSLDKFILNFARFELPNGTKGWLDINGIEYLDDEE